MQKIEIVKKKSIDFTSQEIEQVYDIYEEVFHERRDEKFFKDQYFNTVKGYSYHALAIVDGTVIGHNVYIPFGYLKDGNGFLLVLSADAMISQKFQGQGIYGKLLKACEDMALEEGCKLRIGFPNENSYPIQKKYYKYYDFGTLDIYCMPLKVSGIHPGLRLFDMIFLKIAKYRSKHISNEQKNVLIQFKRDRNTFDTYRYKWFDGDYNSVKLDDGVEFKYKSFKFKNVDALFLIDFYPMSRYSFESACSYIIKNEQEYPILFYVGKLPFKQSVLFKIPKFMEPKKFHFMGKIYDTEFIGKEGLDINNWDVNLSLFDLL